MTKEMTRDEIRVRIQTLRNMPNPYNIEKEINILRRQLNPIG